MPLRIDRAPGIHFTRREIRMDALQWNNRQYAQFGTERPASGAPSDATDAAAALRAIERVIGLCGASFDRTMSRERYPSGAPAHADLERRSGTWDAQLVRNSMLPPAL